MHKAGEGSRQLSAHVQGFSETCSKQPRASVENAKFDSTVTPAKDRSPGCKKCVFLVN